jgi:hypothetical protein
MAGQQAPTQLHQMSDSSNLSEYEAKRLSNIARNKEYMESLGLDINLRANTTKNLNAASKRGLKTPSRKKAKVDVVSSNTPSVHWVHFSF